MTTYPARSLANALLDLAGSAAVDADGAVLPSRPVTGPELSQLVYVAHGFSLALHRRPLLGELAVATRDGVYVPSLRAALGAGPATPLRSFDPETGAFAEDPRPPASDAAVHGALRATWARHARTGPGTTMLDAQGPSSPWTHIVRAPGFQKGAPIPDDLNELYFGALAADEFAGTY